VNYASSTESDFLSGLRTRQMRRQKRHQRGCMRRAVQRRAVAVRLGAANASTTLQTGTTSPKTRSTTLAARVDPVPDSVAASSSVTAEGILQTVTKHRQVSNTICRQQTDNRHRKDVIHKFRKVQVETLRTCSRWLVMERTGWKATCATRNTVLIKAIPSTPTPEALLDAGVKVAIAAMSNR
jgi:hypothetical protein